ncbi:MAG: EAL domain-containing protein [Methylophaga sp.]|nr:EAL domain-containing protein [Methylophaga sp.]
MNEIATSRKTPLLLVVDDELVGRIYIEKALQSEGYDVITAENGQQAYEMAKQHLPNMIIMDVMMPVMDGYQSCVAIRAEEQQLKVPILMLTGLDDIESVEKSFDSGATDFIVKPVNLAIFKQRVRHGLNMRQADLEIYQQHIRQTHAYKIAKMGYWEWEMEANQLYFSDEVYEMLAISREEINDTRDALRARMSIDDFQRIKSASEATIKQGIPYSVEHHVIRPDNQTQIVHHHAELIKNEQGQVVRMFGIIQDITARYLADEQIRHQLYYDSLTDLPNRTLFHEHLDKALKTPSRITDGLAILHINLDRFKNINDSYGPEIGDKFLILIANKLNQVTRSTDLLARVGADEFSFVFEGIRSNDGAEKVANKLLKIFEDTHCIGNYELIITASIGITLSSPNNCDKETLLQQADLAMQHVKEVGGNQFCFYSEQMVSGAYQALIIEKELRRALERDELVLFYQPKVCVNTGIVKGMEALIRWQHPDKGLVSPFNFIPIAEETGLIIQIGKWVFEEACRQTRLWHKQGYDNLTVSINVSAKQFHHQDFEADILNAIEITGIDPHCIDLEVTESCTMNNIEKAISILKRFRDMGIQISLDDFGTGFSSLSLLNQLPLDTLKVDIAFIRDINEKGENGELAKLIILMAKTLGLKTVSEGVELQHHIDFVKDNGGDEYQGFLFSKPVPAADFELVLARNSQQIEAVKAS